MKPHYIAMLAMALAALAGLAEAAESTRVYRQGNSTATISQEGGGSTSTRRVTRGPNSQTIVQKQGGNSAEITQGSRRGKTLLSRVFKSESNVSRMQILVSMNAEEGEELRELALEEDTNVQALVEEAIQDFLDSQ
jgi:hypothetical protein